MIFEKKNLFMDVRGGRERLENIYRKKIKEKILILFDIK